MALVFSCEFCEIFKNFFLTKQLRVTASVRYNIDQFTVHKGVSWILQRRIQNPVKHLRWSVLREYLAA